jgi:drug/metabolite transporter (DMT)-like permease
MNKTILADISLLFVVFIWGATFVMVQNAISFLEPFSFNAIRFTAASVLLLAGYLLVNRVSATKASWSKEMVGAGLKIGIWLFLGYAFQTVGLLTTTPSKAGFITGLSVVLVPLFSVLLLKKPFAMQTGAGVVFATIGLFLLTTGDNSALVIGDVLVFFCAISFAMQIITTAQYAKHFSALPLTIIQVLTVAVLSFLSALLFEDVSMIQPDILLQPGVWRALLVTSVLATAFAFFAQTYFQAYASPTRVAIIFAMEPVFAALTSFILIGEHLTLLSLTGCLLIFAGMIIAELPLGKNKTAKQQMITND